MADIKSRIAKRVAKEMHNGDVVNSLDRKSVV